MSDPVNYRCHGLVSADDVRLASANFDLLDTVDTSFGSDADSEENFPSLEGATAWLNSAPLTPERLRGKVVAVDFWTYTCINWLRTLPYLRAWAEKYQDAGLVVIGVHTPEFPFEHEIENVRRAVKEMQITYPVAVDNDYAVWQAFSNHYWPALYLIDAEGRIRHHQFGEGDYEEAERFIQQMLTEAGNENVGQKLVTVDADNARGPEVAADWEDLASGENYLGDARTDGFASPGGSVVGERRAYTVPERLGRNQWALAGEWVIEPGFVGLKAANGRIVYRFHARDVHLVMGPATRGASVRFRVFIDGQAPEDAHGSDVNEQGEGAVSEQRLHQLIRQPGPVTDRTFEIEFLDAGVEAYAFTFG